MARKRGTKLPPGMAGEMTLEYFLKTYCKQFNGSPNVIEVPFRELNNEGWKYREGKFILEPKGGGA